MSESACQVVESAAVLLIGNELLSGKVREQNLFELARLLRAVGIRLERAVTVLDDVEIIAREIRALSAAHDVVFTSGGVGPTHDDVTIEATARAFGVPLTSHPELEAVLRDAYGLECGEGHLRMARVPHGATLEHGAEPRWPIVVMHNVWLLPGVPEVFRAKLGVIRGCLRGAAAFHSRSVATLVDEPLLIDSLTTVVAAHPEVEVGSYPRWLDADCRTLITFDARSEQAVVAALEHFLRLLPPGEPRKVE